MRSICFRAFWFRHLQRESRMVVKHEPLQSLLRFLVHENELLSYRGNILFSLGLVLRQVPDRLADGKQRGVVRLNEEYGRQAVVTTTEDARLQESIDIDSLEAGGDVVHDEQGALLLSGVLYELLVYPI